jgi:Peptidase M50B-like
MTVLLGGHVTAIRIEPDTSGVTESLVPVGRVSRAFVASAGYLGASAVGCLLMAATRVDRRAHAILRTVGACMLLTLVVWIRNLFGFVVVLVWGIALVVLGEKTSDWAKLVLSLLAIQVALDAVYDIRVLFLVERGRSDAATMARLFLLPEWLWAAAWMAISVAMFAWTLRVTRR